jgi:hypothetical protein
MSKEHAATFEELFKHIFLGRLDAIRLATIYVCAFHIWDDFIDEDPIAKETVNDLFKALLLELPTNQLYVSNLVILRPIIFSIYTQWHTANTFERNKEQLEKAYMLRAGMYQLFVILAELVGGTDWAEEVSPLIFSTYGEDLAEFMQEVKNA